MRLFSPLSLCLLTLVAACGGKTEDDGGAAGSSGSGAGASAGKAGAGGSAAGAGGVTAGAGGAVAGAAGAGGGAPDGCLIAAQPSGPHATVFRLKNTTTGPVTLWQDCEIEKSITSCESGFSTPLSTSGACTAECNDPMMGCIACAPCPSQALTLGPGQAKEVTWAGNVFTFGTNTGCMCHNTLVAPAAHYRLSVPIYPELQSGGPFGPKPASTRTVVQDFVLPSPGGVVEVSLAP